MRPRLFLVLAGVVLLARPGWAGEGVVALQTADPSCRTTTSPPPRYVDCGNGTVTDNRTGLVWLKNAECLNAAVDWWTAIEFVAGLSDLPNGFCTGLGLTEAECDCGISDGSSPGEWRLASVAEWRRMTEDAIEIGCSPSITNDAGNDCWDQQCVDAGACSFSGVQSAIYWSSTTFANGTDFAWVVFMNFGLVSSDGKTFYNRVWPVRGGQ